MTNRHQMTTFSYAFGISPAEFSVRMTAFAKKWTFENRPKGLSPPGLHMDIWQTIDGTTEWSAA